MVTGGAARNYRAMVMVEEKFTERQRQVVQLIAQR